ncbi:hypothetical protein BOTNAR_0381g00080 [Botryotinia narcissicola]|uniref:Major facilitator superfamily (MFS) profile domain-containing protein n=1 Tax=Botryotinia narcissicola TaxID=278944 RepID=A0A4Z1HNU0_9HELO|nr:hypothetical protein BOTNAR_0381g00080 [Botryotinia narcissicola]
MRFRFNNLAPNELPIAENTAHASSVDEEKTPTTTANVLSQNDSEVINKEFQHGVQAAEAINQVLTRNNLILAYILLIWPIWIIEFLLTFASGLTITLTPYVTSSFQAHSLTATTSIISSLIAGLIKLPYAKLMDIWGRPQAFCVMVASFTLGMVMMAGCNDVKTYCAAQVFYYVGYNGIDFTLTIFIADKTQIKNRAWWIAFSSSPWIAFSSSPWIATVWAYGPAAQSVLKTIGCRWGFAWYIWDSYFYSMLIVVFNQSVTNATYISNIYTIGSCFWALVVGIIIRFNGRLKWLALYFGVPITILAVGLLIKFRQPDTNIGYIVMCQTFIAFGGGTLVMCEQMTVMAVSSHQHIPAILAMEAMIASVGGAIGSTIAAALWTGIFPVKLAELLPASSQADFTSIYGSLVVQSSYPQGSDTRKAINQAYGDTQRLMLICATCLYFVTLISTMFWRNINVKDMKPIHGRIW